jgi:hypothetical protein
MVQFEREIEDTKNQVQKVLTFLCVFSIPRQVRISQYYFISRSV